jgi:hypothetical protein
MPKGPEYQLQSQIAQLAHLLGWETVAFRPAMTKHGMRTPGTGSMAKGWPDMTLVHPEKQRLIFAELKSNVGRLRPDQERVIGVLSKLAGMWADPALLSESQFAHLRVEVVVWKPKDWPQIEQALR